MACERVKPTYTYMYTLTIYIYIYIFMVMYIRSSGVIRNSYELELPFFIEVLVDWCLQVFEVLIFVAI